MKGNLVLCFFLYFVSFLAARSHAGQGDGLPYFWQGKMESKTKKVGPKVGKVMGLTSSNNFGTDALNEGEDSHSNGVVQVLPQQGLKDKDRITGLPGQPRKAIFEQYGGYVTVNQKAGRALFYYFVEAEGPKDSMPLLLWFNGGPGCSSIAYGALQELGPFRVKSDGKTLFENTYAWNKVANVLFLESPVGTGFSYSNTTDDYSLNGDRRAADDSYVFLVNWLERFPEFKNRSFYIAGESYAGHYVPQLADTILQHNKMGGNIIINLKGIAIGNPSMDDALDGIGEYEFLASHSIITENMVDEMRKSCDFSDVFYKNKTCLSSTVKAHDQSGHINPYSILDPVCYSTSVTATPKEATLLKFDTCSEYYVDAYLNDPDVQEAIHATKTDYLSCQDMDWKDQSRTILQFLQGIMAQGVPVWVYSGDEDSVVPFVSTTKALKKLNLTEQASWRPWYNGKQVAGYTVVYNGGLTYATVKGAGHEVPSYQPKASLILVSSFLKGKPLPASSLRSITAKPGDGGFGFQFNETHFNETGSNSSNGR